MRTIHQRATRICMGILCLCPQLYATENTTVASDDQIIRDFERYLPELTDITPGHEPMLSTLFELNRTPPDVQRGILEIIYNNLIVTNPHKDTVAKVRTFDTFVPSPAEYSVIEKRKQVCKKAIEQLIKKPITENQLPRIGLCFSGGGMRAAISADGFMKGLAKINLLDSVLYTSSLSGSTWLFGAWHISNAKIEDFADEILIRISKGILGKKISEQLSDILSSSSVVAESLFRRIAFDETPTVIDLYGLMLGLTFFDATQRKNMLKLDLTCQLPLLADGQRPFPLYSATYVTTGKKKPVYAWVEFSPCEVACYKHKAGTSAWGYGRRFDGGESKNAAPSLPLCYLMGIWGSAISASCGEVFGMILNHLEPKALFEPLKLLIEETVIGDIRIFPAVIRNMTYQLQNAPDQTSRSHTIIDAGLACNIPTPPLLCRNLDIIIIADFSANLTTGTEMHRVEDYARKNNLPFPKISYEGLDTRNYTVFDENDGETPIVVYVPLIKNSRYSSTFDPLELMKVGNFMHTFNLSYTLTQARATAGLMEFTAVEMKELLTDMIARVANRKAA